MPRAALSTGFQLSCTFHAKGRTYHYGLWWLKKKNGSRSLRKMPQGVSTRGTAVLRQGERGLPQAGWAVPGLILRDSLRSGKQLAHAFLGFVLFWALLALMVFLGLAGLGAGGLPFGFGVLLRLVRPAARFLS